MIHSLLHNIHLEILKMNCKTICPIANYNYFILDNFLRTTICFTQYTFYNIFYKKNKSLQQMNVVTINVMTIIHTNVLIIKLSG